MDGQLKVTIEPRRGAWSETVLDVDGLITHVFVPGPPANAQGVYVKVSERATWHFALVSVGAQIELTDHIVDAVRVELGGVAPMPWHPREAEEALGGQAWTAGRIEEAASASSSGALPLSDNGYKVRLVEGAVREALRRLKQT